MELTRKDIEHAARQAPGEVVVYLLDRGLYRVYTSGDIPSLTGLSKSEFASVSDQDALDLVARSDRDIVLAEIERGMSTDGEFDVTYRILNRDEGFVWIHGQGRKIGEMDGKPVIMCTLINASRESAQQYALAEYSGRPVSVIDRVSFEILYMNNACSAIYHGRPHLDQTCYGYKYGLDHPCDWCPVLHMEGDSEHLDDFFVEKTGHWFQFDYHRIEWFGRDSVAIYAFDITQRREEQAQLKGTLDREERLVGYIQTLNGPGTFDDHIAEVLRELGAHLDADRTYLFRLEDDGRVTNTHEWCREGVVSEIDSFQNAEASPFSRWIPRFEMHQSVVAPDIALLKTTKPEEYEIMRRWGVNGFAEAPLIIDDRLYGFIGVDNPKAAAVEHCGDTLLSVAYSISGALIRDHEERELEAAKRRYELAIDGAELGVWEYDIAKHTIFSPSDSFRKFGVTGKIENVPESLLPMFDEGEQARLIDFYRRIDAGESKLSGDFWIRWHPGMPQRCERVIYTVEAGPDGNPGIAYGIGMNYTSQKLEQENFERSIQQMLAIDPDTLCTCRINLTQDTCDYLYGAQGQMDRLTDAENLESLAEKVAEHLATDADRERFTSAIFRARLIDLFNEGVTDVTDTYRRRLPDGKMRWFTLRISIASNPQTSDVIAAASAVDGDDETVRARILELITRADYDHISIIYPDESTFRLYYHNPDEPSGFTAEQMTGTADYRLACRKAARDWVYPEGAERFLEDCSIDNIVSHLEDGDSYSFEMDTVARDGSRRRKILSYAYLDEEHGRIMEGQRDITDIYREQQRALHLAQAETQRVEDIMDSISTGICVMGMTDPDHLTVDYANLQMYRMIGFDVSRADARESIEAQPLVKRYFEDAFSGIHPDDVERVRKTFRDHFDSDGFQTGFYRIMGAGGRYLWVSQEIRLREVRTERHILYTAYRAVDEEVRLKGELEHQLKEETRLREQADAANRAKSDFLSNVSHDMRTPLNAVLGYADLAQNTQDAESIRAYLSKIRQSGKVLQQLIDDTLDLNRISSGTTVLHLEPTDALDIFADLETAIRPSMDAKDIRLVKDFGDCPMARVDVDVVRTREVFLNLLNNAVKFTPRGGTITFSVERLATEGDTAHDRITISDTGCGMSSQFLARAFEPFTQERTAKTADIEGTGLGLSIVKGLVELMGGHIEVRSTLDEGSVFDIYLDFHLAGRAEDEVGGDIHDAVTLIGRKVLVVEDNEMNTEIARLLLERRGIKVDCARDGQEGLKRFAGAQPGEYDAICMDLRMPVMNGFEATRAIRALPRPDATTIPIIAMTANAYDDDVRACLDAGMNAHVAKPIDPATLYGTLAAHLDAQPETPDAS